MMKIRFYIPALLTLLLFPVVHAQENDVILSGNFSGMDFTRFVDELEEQSGVTFYFMEEWVEDIDVNTSGKDLSLKKILTETLLPRGLFYYIDENRNVYITKDRPLIHTLPSYSGSNTAEMQNPDQEEEDVSETEKKYMEGRKAGLRETIIIGKGEGGMGKAFVNGKVTDSENSEPLIGATIYVHELKKGTVTDVNGRYNLAIPPGKYTVDFSSMGMEQVQYYLDVRSGGRLDVSMDKSLIPISEVVVTTNRYHNVKGTQMGFERLDYRKLNEIPVVLGEKDILKIAQMLPGVQNTGEGSAGFNVRGSGADQNMIYVNRVPVYNSSHLFGFFSSFSPDIIKDFSLYKSNLPARFGGRLSSFLDITTRQGNMKKYTARGGISPITGHLAVEGPIVKDKSAFVLSGRTTYSDWILNRLKDPDLRGSDASFYDYSGILSWEPNEKNLVKAFGYYSKDNFSLGSGNHYNYSNAGSSVSLRHRFGSQASGDFAAIYSEYSFGNIDESNLSYATQHDYQIEHFELKADMNWLSEGIHKVDYGANAIYYRLNRGVVEPYGENSLRLPVDLGSEEGIEAAVYVADEISLTRNLTLYGGLRYSAFMALGPSEVLRFSEGLPFMAGSIVDTMHFNKSEVVENYSGFEPRFAMNYLLGRNNSVKFTYNRLRQYLFMLSNTYAISPTDQWKLCDYNIKPPYVDQVSAGYYQEFPRKALSTSLEIYHKWGYNIIDYKDGADFKSGKFIELETLQGNQKAWGLELMIKKTAGKVNGWLAYSYSRSFLQFDSEFSEGRINGGKTFPANYDRPHNLNLVMNYKTNRRLSLSANVVYITGRPITYPISVYYMDNKQYVHYSERNKYRIPDYFRVDFSINLEGNLKKNKLAHSYWMLNIYNLTGRKNAYSVFFNYDEGNIQGYKLSVFGQPIITLSWNFKFGNYASE